MPLWGGAPPTRMTKTKRQQESRGRPRMCSWSTKVLTLSPAFVGFFSVLLGEGPIRLCWLPVLGCLSPPPGLLPPSGHRWLLLLGPWETTWRQPQGYAGPASLKEDVESWCRGLAWSRAFCVYARAQGATRDFGRLQESTLYIIDKVRIRRTCV